MGTFWKRTRAACAATLLTAGIGLPGAVRAELAAGDHEIVIEHAGTERTARVHVPKRSGGGPAPAVLSFHGGGGSAEGHRDGTGLDELAEREGFVSVYPSGTPARPGGRRLRTWNAGSCCGRAVREDVDDVGYVVGLIDVLVHRKVVDPERVYLTGHSNGAMMAQRVAAEHPDHIAAIVSVGGIVDLESPPRVPLLHIHSVDDPRALYAGGLAPRFPLSRQRTEHPPVERVLRTWARAGGCAEEPTTSEERTWRDDAGGATHTATRLIYAGCDRGFALEQWRLGGAGHGWPGSAEPLPERLVGAPSEVIDANEEAWSFLQRYPRSGDTR